MAAVEVKPSRRTKRIDARAAAHAAAAYFRELYPNVTAFSLEEVELSEDNAYWLITLSFEVVENKHPLTPFHAPRTKFKVFKVDARTGRVVAMKIRKLE